MIDLHCHILPGTDDGARDLDEALGMARHLARLGFGHVCATPHQPWGAKALSHEDIVGRCRRLSEALEREDIRLVLTPSAEHHASQVPEHLASNRLLCMPRGDTFLMEFPLAGFPDRLQDLLFQIQVKGKVAVVCHVERYPEVQKDPAIVEVLAERGCKLLVNLTSLAGKWDRGAQRVSRDLVRQGMVDAATTDMHSIGEAGAVEEGLAVLEDLVGPEGVDRMLRRVPAELLGPEAGGEHEL